jgi:hypothetical protein
LVSLAGGDEQGLKTVELLDDFVYGLGRREWGVESAMSGEKWSI